MREPSPLDVRSGEHAAPPLATLQRWMQAVITHPGGVVPGITAARQELDVPPESVEQVVRRSRQLTAVERLAVYGNAYFARLLECLRAEFPVLLKTLGSETFDVFAAGYLQDVPSTSYTLGVLGRQFPEYLRENRPPRTDSETLDWADWVIDLATLERVRSEVFDGPGEERDTPRPVASLDSIPLEERPTARLQLTRSLRLLSLRFDVLDCFMEPTDDNPTAVPPAPSPCWVVVHRKDWRVRLTPLTREQFQLLSLLHDGTPLEMALRETFCDAAPPDAEALRLWFHDWTVAGLIRGTA